MSKDDGTFNLNDLGYELPDLCEDCGGIPSTKDDDEWNILVLQIPKFYYEQHGDCSCHDEPSSKGEREE